MFIVITTISIVAITGLVWGAKKILPFPVCPICAGVSGTWLWMLGLRFLGYPIDIAVLAIDGLEGPVYPSGICGGLQPGLLVVADIWNYGFGSCGTCVDIS